MSEISQSFRNKYMFMIRSNQIPNVLGMIDTLSYSRKFKILENLLACYPIYSIIVALNKYKINYIDLDRVNVFFIEKILKGLCKKF